MKNAAHSIQERLRTVARSGGKEFQLILTRYFQERLLFRISQSPYAGNFCLKGGALLYAFEKEASRPTLDIDLLSLKIQRDVERFKGIFDEICGISFPADGVQFETDRLAVREIMEQRKYAGLEIKAPVSLGNMKQLLKIDVGFGDVATPPPSVMIYPTLLDMEAPEIKAYSPETIIAEKFEAMIDLAEANSRMKDFYDVYQLLSKDIFDPEILQEAVRQTFKRRNTALSAGHPLFHPAFAEAPGRVALWNNFLQRAKLDEKLAFSEVMEVIRKRLMPEEYK
jgi:predicted nucleotidyltransferase component of viral defense system